MLYEFVLPTKRERRGFDSPSPHHFLLGDRRGANVVAVDRLRRPLNLSVKVKIY